MKSASHEHVSASQILNPTVGVGSRHGVNFTGSNGSLRMLKSINLFYASSIMTGVIIGSGIFVSPISFIANTGSVAASLILWVVCGFIVLGVACCYMELGTMLKTSGAEYSYYKKAFGDFPAFLYAWISLISYYPAFYGLLALTSTDYVFNYMFAECEIPSGAKTIFSSLIVVLVVAVNCTYVKHVAKFQTFFTVTKLMGLLLIIVIGIVQLARGRTEILSQGFENSNTDPTAYASAIYSGLFTYGGWQFVFIMMEEVTDPERVAPKATIISMILVICIYTLTNVAYFSVLTPHEMLTSSAVAMTFADKTIGRYSAIIPFLVACSTIGALNGSIMGGSRVYFAAARDNLFPPIFSGLQLKYLTPWPSLILTCIVTILYILTGSAVALIEYVGFIGTIVFALTIVAMLWLRYKQPNLRRPFKAPISVAVVVLVMTVVLLLMGLYHKPKQYGIGVLLIASGIPFYVIFHVIKWKPRAVLEAHRTFTSLIEKTLLVYPSDK